ncbi:MAG: hypothetical protein CSA62_15215 [Planctomycetota bacterium]|nr:MAG: hypothetical protein CSA62_15215 [Planctomycetota bacterium]
MTDSTTPPEKKPLAKDPASFTEFLSSLVGRVVTFANPESLEDAAMGYVLKTGFYRTKLLAVHNDYFCVAAELVHKGKETRKEPVRQFIPMSAIKRVTVGKSDILVHV